VKVLIVGGTRFLGAAIASELCARGHQVTALHRGKTRGDVPEQVEHILCDAHERAEVEPHLTRRFDAVVDTILTDSDLAWYLPLLQDCAERFIHCGSTGVYTPPGGTGRIQPETGAGHGDPDVSRADRIQRMLAAGQQRVWSR